MSRNNGSTRSWDKWGISDQEETPRIFYRLSETDPWNYFWPLPNDAPTLWLWHQEETELDLPQ